MSSDSDFEENNTLANLPVTEEPDIPANLPGSLNEEDMLKYGKNLAEMEELKTLEVQFSKTSSDLEETKSKLSILELEIRTAREIEEKRKQKVEELILKGKDALDGKRLEEALDHYLHVLEEDHKNPRAIHYVQEIKTLLKEQDAETKRREEDARKIAQEARKCFEMGKKYYRENNFEKALESVNTALSIGGKNSEFLDYKEKCELRIHEIEENLNRAKREIEEKKRLVSEYQLTANTHFRKKEYDSGILLLEKALYLIPDNKEVQESLRQAENKYKEFLQVQEKDVQLKKQKQEQLRELEVKALEMVRNEDYENAIKCIEQGLKICPERDDFALFLKELNEKYLTHKKFCEEKEEKQNKAKQERQNLLKEYYAKALQAFMVCDLDLAANYFGNVMVLDPHYEQVETYLQKISDLKKNIEAEKKEAELKAFEKQEALEKIREEEKNRKNQELVELFSSALKLASEENYEGALTRFEKCYALDPFNETFRKEVENTRKFLNEKRVRERLEKAREEERREEEKSRQLKIQFHLEQAESYLNNNHALKAKEEWDKILSLDSCNQKARDGLLKCENFLLAEEQKCLREEQLKKEIVSRIEKINFEAKLLLKEDKFYEAINLYESALNLDSGNNDAKNGILECKQFLLNKNTCDELKSNVERLLQAQVNRLDELKQTISEGAKFYQEKDYSKALGIWNSITHQLKKQD